MYSYDLYQISGVPVRLRNRHIPETYTVLWLKGQHYVKYYINQTAPATLAALPHFVRQRWKRVLGTITCKATYHVRKIGLKF
jgi:hypothetical protein